MAKKSLSIAEILDMPPSEVPKPYRGRTVCRNAKEAKREVLRMQGHADAPKNYLDACSPCEPKEIEWMNSVLAGRDHTEAATSAYGLYGRSAVNKGALLYGRVPRVMLALDIGRRELAKKVDYTLEKVIADVDAAIQFAKDNDNPASYVTAIKMKAQLSGHLGKDDGRPDGTFQLHIHAG